MNIYYHDQIAGFNTNILITIFLHKYYKHIVYQQIRFADEDYNISFRTYCVDI